jgi:hypothetical protein
LGISKKKEREEDEDSQRLSTRPELLVAAGEVGTGIAVRRIQSLSTVVNSAERPAAKEVEVHHPVDDIKSVRAWVQGGEDEAMGQGTVVMLAGLGIEGVEGKKEGEKLVDPKESIKTVASSSEASYHTAKSSISGDAVTDETDDSDDSMHENGGGSFKSTSTIKTGK